MAQDLQFTFRRACLEVSGEIGSLAELIGYMQEESATLTAAFGDDMELVVQRIGSATGEPTKDTAEPEPTKRKPRTTKPVEAVAPEPLPVPSAAAAPPPPTVTTLPPNALPAPAANPLDIPPYLRRPETAPPLPAAVAPPPPTLPSPPLAPTPPPVGVLGPKVVAALEVLRAGQPDGGAALADWLHGCGLTQKDATYDAACRVVLMTSDEKLGQIAEQLKVAA